MRTFKSAEDLMAYMWPASSKTDDAKVRIKRSVKDDVENTAVTRKVENMLVHVFPKLNGAGKPIALHNSKTYSKFGRPNIKNYVNAGSWDQLMCIPWTCDSNGVRYQTAGMHSPYGYTHNATVGDNDELDCLNLVIPFDEYGLEESIDHLVSRDLAMYNYTSFYSRGGASRASRELIYSL